MTMNSTRAFRSIFIVMSLLLMAGCTIVRHDEETRKSGDSLSIYFDTGEFDAAVFVDSVWEDKVLPRIREKAVEAETLFTKLKEQPREAVESFGYRIEVTAPFNFMVKGRAAILAVNTESSASTISLSLSGPDGNPVMIQIGPVLKGTAIRDSMDFINFEDFTNQLEFANVSREMNNRVKADVLDGFNRDVPPGTDISFTGAFQWVEGRGVVITPVELKVGE